MSCLKVAAVAAGVALVASPCLAFTYSPAPVDTSGRSMLTDPDANLENTSSAMQDAYMRNNGGDGPANSASVQGSLVRTVSPEATLGFGNGVAPVTTDDHGPISSAHATSPSSAQNDGR